MFAAERGGGASNGGEAVTMNNEADWEGDESSPHTDGKSCTLMDLIWEGTDSTSLGCGSVQELELLI